MSRDVTEYLAYFSAILFIGGWLLIFKSGLVEKDSVPTPTPTIIVQEQPVEGTPLSGSFPSPTPTQIPAGITPVSTTRPSINFPGEFED